MPWKRFRIVSLMVLVAVAALVCREVAESVGGRPERAVVRLHNPLGDFKEVPITQPDGSVVRRLKLFEYQPDDPAIKSLIISWMRGNYPPGYSAAWVDGHTTIRPLGDDLYEIALSGNDPPVQAGILEPIAEAYMAYSYNAYSRELDRQRRIKEQEEWRKYQEELQKWREELQKRKEDILHAFDHMKPPVLRQPLQPPRPPELKPSEPRQLIASVPGKPPDLRRPPVPRKLSEFEEYGVSHIVKWPEGRYRTVSQWVWYKWLRRWFL